MLLLVKLRGKSNIPTIILIETKTNNAKKSSNNFLNNFILVSFKRSLFKGFYIIVNTIYLIRVLKAFTLSATGFSSALLIKGTTLLNLKVYKFSSTSFLATVGELLKTRRLRRDNLYAFIGRGKVEV